MSNVDKIKAQLTEYEKEVLPLVSKYPFFHELIKHSSLQEVTATRGVQWLTNKGLVTVVQEEQTVVDLDTNGKKYQQKGLPEDIFLKAIAKESLSKKKLMKVTGLSEEEVSISIGTLKKVGAISIDKKEDLIFSITELGKQRLLKPSLDAQFLAGSFPRPVAELAPEEKAGYDALIKRKQVIKTSLKKNKHISLTELGQKVLASGLSTEKNTGRLTPGMLKTGSWKKETFRPYDIQATVPKIMRGKKHFENEAIDYAKRIWLNLGFEEMEGTHIQTAFWDLDVLFVPQDHPAREMQDTFYVKDPSRQTIDQKLAKLIKDIHEKGGSTGSKGWGNTWDKSIAEQLLLRTHTTVLSAHTLHHLTSKDLPAKFFKVGKVYRNEALDWKHLFEFYQVDGIVVDEHANLKQLKGYVEQFYKLMGYDKIRIRPAHFPYTEPSLEIEVFHPVKKEWIELGGAGIFRPEVTVPLLGKDIPVLAWGLGLPRIIMPYYRLTDARDIYKNDLKQLQEMKAWLQ